MESKDVADPQIRCLDPPPQAALGTRTKQVQPPIKRKSKGSKK